MMKKTSYIKRLFLSLIVLYIIIFISIFIFQNRIFRNIYTKRVINNTIEEIDNTYNTMATSNLNDALVEFSQATQTSTLIIPSEQLKQDIGVLNYLLAEVESGGMFYNVYVPNNRIILNSIGKPVSMTLYEHTTSNNYIPSFLSIDGRKAFGNTSGQISMMFRDLIPSTDINSKIEIEGVITKIIENTVINTTQLNPIAAEEILTIITEDYSEAIEFDSGFYYVATDTEDNYSNLVFYSKRDVNGSSIILVAVYPLSHIDDIVQAVKLLNTYTFLIVFVVLIGASLVYSNSFSKPLLKINKATKSLASLDFSENSLILDRNDEFGELSENINILSNNLKRTLGTLTLQNKQLSTSLDRENENEFSRRNFVRGLSHEIKTPLAVIQASSEAIQNNIYESDEDKLKALKTIQSEVTRTSNILNSMMQVYKIDIPNFKDTWEKISIKDIYNELIESLSVLIKGNNLSIKSDIEESFIDGDYEKMSLVLSNLLSNAIKYATPNSVIEITLSNKNSICEFEISNMTPPIHQNELDHLFDPFYKVDKSGDRTLNSTGLGLYIVQQTLKQYSSFCDVQYVDNKISFKLQIKSSY